MQYFLKIQNVITIIGLFNLQAANVPVVRRPDRRGLLGYLKGETGTYNRPGMRTRSLSKGHLNWAHR